MSLWCKHHRFTIFFLRLAFPVIPGYSDYMSLSPSRKEPFFFDSSSKTKRLRVHVDQEGQRLDNFLFGLCKKVPRSHIYKVLRKGQIHINESKARANYRILKNDLVQVPTLYLSKTQSPRKVHPSEFPVVFEDDALMVVDKPAGTAVHGGSGIAFGIIEQLRASSTHARFLELVHRLDRETSGLLMIAKKRRALLALHAMLRAGKVKKYYLALVEGKWSSKLQHICMPLTKWVTHFGERRVRVDSQGQRAHTIVTLQKQFRNHSLVKIQPLTGRTHQIRVHLAATGFPIAGDQKYGNSAAGKKLTREKFSRMFLHANQLALTHPLSGKPLCVKAPIPPTCCKVLDTLENLEYKFTNSLEET